MPPLPLPLPPLPLLGVAPLGEQQPRAAWVQALAPPRKNHPLLFTHIPKCAGSSFRNSLLLEYVRTRRAASKFACVFYRDLSFHENKSSSLTTAGPDCLGADGRIGSRYLVVTGHISYHPQLLARMRAPFTALMPR